MLWHHNHNQYAVWHDQCSSLKPILVFLAEITGLDINLQKIIAIQIAVGILIRKIAIRYFFPSRSALVWRVKSVPHFCSFSCLNSERCISCQNIICAFSLFTVAIIASFLLDYVACGCSKLLLYTPDTGPHVMLPLPLHVILLLYRWWSKQEIIL